MGLGEDGEAPQFLPFLSPKRPQIAWTDMLSLTYMDPALLVGSGRTWGRGSTKVPPGDYLVGVPQGSLGETKSRSSEEFL